MFNQIFCYRFDYARACDDVDFSQVLRGKEKFRECFGQVWKGKIRQAII